MEYTPLPAVAPYPFSDKRYTTSMFKPAKVVNNAVLGNLYDYDRSNNQVVLNSNRSNKAKSSNDQSQDIK